MTTIKHVALATFSCVLLASCGEAPQDNATKAQHLAQSSIIVDTHIDVPYRIFDSHEDVSVATEKGDFDYPRAVAGGLNAPFMSVYIPAEMEATGEAYDHAEKLIDLVEGIAANAPDKFAVAKSVQDVKDHFAKGLISLPMGMENGAPITGSLDNLQHFYERGIRYITLTHSKWNHISDSSYDPDKHWGGLSDFGKELVIAMNNTGVMVDISHVSDDAFWDAIKVTKAPLVATHSSLRHFTPGFERNMSDEMVVALAKNGGVIQINFGSSFVTEAANNYGKVRDAAYTVWLAEQGFNDTPENKIAFRESYSEMVPYPFATMAETLDHFDRVVELVGIDHVGIGSDYDGVGDSLPIGLKDVSTFPALIEGLLNRGYSDEDITKLLGGNILRVWSEVEAYAAAN